MPAAEARWTDDELREAIAGYREVQARELSGKPAKTTDLHKQLSEASSGGRSIGSFGRRMTNISSVLVEAGLDRATTYPPTLGNVGSGVRKRILALWFEDAELKPTADPRALAAMVTLARPFIANEPIGQEKPATVARTVKSFVRDPKVVAWVLKHAKGCCEACGEPAPFQSDDSQPFLEVHHVVTLGEGGADTVANCVAVCPNCHKALHYAADRQSRRALLLATVDRLK